MCERGKGHIYQQVELSTKFPFRKSKDQSIAVPFWIAVIVMHHNAPIPLGL